MSALDGKVVLVTGGARGQGRAHAVTSAREGADVVLLDLADTEVASAPYPMATGDDMAETVRLVEAHGRRAVAVTGDVRSQADQDEAVRRGLAEFGRIDCLVANAGIVSLGPIWEIDDATWQDMLDINLTGVWRSVKAVLPHMIERGCGSVVMTSSINGEEPASGYGHYTASKHGVLGLMRSVALEGAEHDIRCNAILPASIMTDMVTFPELLDRFAGHPGQGTPEHALRAGYYYHALPRPSMSPQVSADAALFLNSDLASAITGVALRVDAGHGLNPRVNRDPVALRGTP